MMIAIENMLTWNKQDAKNHFQNLKGYLGTKTSIF